MKTILVPLDGSALAEQVMPYVRSLASFMPSTIHLLHIVSEADRYHLLFDDPYGVGEPTSTATATHGYSGLRRWALGSVTDRVLHITNTPMLIVRGAEKKAGEPRFKRIMLTLDGSALARQATPLATEIATLAQAELVVLTAVAPPYLEAPELMGAYYSYDEALVVVRERLTEELGLYADVLKQHHVPVTPIAVSGLPAEAIVDE